jgi:voltage-gated potassium channel Kch
VWARWLLWAVYFAAPLVTATALLEIVWAIALPMAYRIRRLRDHTVIIGAGRLAELYLAKLREHSPRALIVMVDKNPDNPRLQPLVAKYPMTVVLGDINNPVTLGLLRLAHARRVLILTGNDFTNLNAASFILDNTPSLAGRIVLHVSNLRILRSLDRALASQATAVFNTHEIAARHLIQQYLLERFAQPAHPDTVVLAGFGRFGQSVLQALQELAPGRFAQLIVVDFKGQERMSAFADRVGIVGDYAQHVVSGSLLDCNVWASLDQRCQLMQKAPLIVVGADDDMVNLEAALWLRRRYADAFVVARHFQRSSFSSQIASACNIVVFSIADLVTEAIPAEWCAPAEHTIASVMRSAVGQ